MPTVSKATSRKRGAAKTVRAAQRTPLPGDQVTETVTAKKAKKATQPKPLTLDAEENREKFSKLCQEIGARLVEERKRFGRAKLAELVGITPSQIWRCEAPQSRGRPHEIEKIQAVFARIDSGELVPPEKPKPFGGKTGGASKAKLKDTLDQIEHVLTSVPAKSNVTQLRAAVSAALELIEKARA